MVAAPPVQTSALQLLVDRFASELRDPASPLWLPGLDSRADGVDLSAMDLEMFVVAVELKWALVAAARTDEVVHDRSAAGSLLRELAKRDGPTAPLARRELELYDRQQVAPAQGGTAHVLPQLSPDAPEAHRQGQRETETATYRLVAETHAILVRAGLGSGALWKALARLVKVAFPAEPEPTVSAVHATYLPRGRQAIARSEAIPSTLDEETRKYAHVSYEEWEKKSEEVCREIFERSLAGGPASGGPDFEPQDPYVDERVGPLLGPHALWREITSTPRLVGEEAPTPPPSARDGVDRLVRAMRGSFLGPGPAADELWAELETGLTGICRAHPLMVHVLESWWRERPGWDQLAVMPGTADAARRVLDCYPRWLLEPPWAPAARFRLIDVLPKPGLAAKPHIEAIVDRLSVVLVRWELRRTGVRAKDSWLWVHRALAVARQNPHGCELALQDEGSLENAYSEGRELYRRLRAPLPSPCSSA